VFPFPFALIIIHPKSISFEDVENTGGSLAFTRTSIYTSLILSCSFQVIKTASMATQRKDSTFLKRNAILPTFRA
jgi:hypothetical protein